MQDARKRRSSNSLLVLAFLLGLPVWAQRSYVGSDACAPCHDQQPEWLTGSVHEKSVLPRKDGESITGCETCHGPGSEHIEDLTAATILTFNAESAGERSEACLACHDSSHAELNFRRSAHQRRNVGCSECHTVTGSEGFHSMRSVGDVMSRAEPGLCFDCHAEQRADFALPYHHPVAERFMGCSSCHEPHGTFTLRQMRTRHSEAVCGGCHEDLQGPFIFEHPAGRASGCQSCHQPHGSTNSKMLTRSRTQFLCLECHASTPSSHDLTQTEYQDCTVCHSQIHGSNLNRLLLR